MLLEILRRRDVSPIDRARQERLLVVGPELAHARVSLDYGIHELAARALAPADKDVADDVSVRVELHSAARSIGQRHLVQSVGERLAVAGLVAEHLDRGLDALAGNVHAGRIAAG